MIAVGSTWPGMRAVTVDSMMWRIWGRVSLCAADIVARRLVQATTKAKKGAARGALLCSAMPFAAFPDPLFDFFVGVDSAESVPFLLFRDPNGGEANTTAFSESLETLQTSTPAPAFLPRLVARVGEPSRSHLPERDDDEASLPPFRGDASIWLATSFSCSTVGKYIGVGRSAFSRFWKSSASRLSSCWNSF